MWRTTKTQRRRLFAPCKLCGKWLSAHTIAEHWRTYHRDQWICLQVALDAHADLSEETEKVE